MKANLPSTQSGRVRVLGRLGLVFGGAACFAVAAGRPVEACSILPPPMPPALSPMPGESDGDYRSRQALHMDGFQALQRQLSQDATRERQKDLWTRADKVALVEVVSMQREVEIPNMMMGRGVRATVKPVGWIKGSQKGRAGRAAFVLAHVSYTSCGPSPNWSVFAGKPGDRFLVFMNASAPAQDATLDVVSPSDIVFGDLTTALAAQVR